MKIRIITEHSKLGYWLASNLESNGHNVEIVEGAVGFGLIHTKNITSVELLQLQTACEPFIPSISKSERMDVDVEICLSPEPDSEPANLSLISPDEEQLSSITADFVSAGYKIETSAKGFYEKNILVYGKVCVFQRQFALWLLHLKNIKIVEKYHEDADEGDIGIVIKPNDFTNEDFGFQVPIIINSDDADFALGLSQRLKQSGFNEIQIKQLDYDQAIVSKNIIKASALMRLSDYSGLKCLKEETCAALAEFGLTVDAHPLEVESKYDPDDPEELITEITVPVSSCKHGDRRPYAGDFPQRFSVHISSDCEEVLPELQKRFFKEGFREITLEKVPVGVLEGFQVQWKRASIEQKVSTSVRTIMEDWVSENDIPSIFQMHYLEGNSKSSIPLFEQSSSEDEIKIILPVAEAQDGRLLTRLSSAEKYSLKWNCDHFDKWEGLFDGFIETLGFKEVHNRGPKTEPDWTIQYGSATNLVLDRICQELKDRYGATPRLKKSWSDTDDDIYIHLPDMPADDLVSSKTTQEATAIVSNLDSWSHASQQTVVHRSFVSAIDRHLWVGSVQLKRSVSADDALVPNLSQFQYYCVDKPTAETFLHIARSVEMNEPCLLEGETSTSKTSSILYLAAQLGQPVVRLNLNGQTDTGELIGRYVPGDDSEKLPFEVSELLESADLIDSRTRKILEKALSEQRALTPLEIQQVKASETIPTQQWRWQEGLVPQAMRNGWWLVLDECNLAEPQILERLNSVLEQEPSLVLSEHDNSVIGTETSPVHAGFRIFATMNPAEYAGRSELSPAYRDRWRGYLYVSPAGEQQYLAMLRFMVMGISPSVIIEGCEYQAQSQTSRYPLLAKLPDIDQFLSALARFHAGLEQAVGQGGGAVRMGSRRRESYVFTRRVLLSFLDYASHNLALSISDDGYDSIRRGLLRYYAGRMTSQEDIRTLIQLLDAVGIGPSVWTIGADSDGEPVKSQESNFVIAG